MPEAIERTKDLRLKTHMALQSPDNEVWRNHCREITRWGGMQDVPEKLAEKYKKSVDYLLHHDPGMDADFKALPVHGKRIATASKIYYYADPLRWTIFDSRVGYAIHQLMYAYAKNNGTNPESLLPDIPFCLPESQTSRREPVFPVSRCAGSETNAMASFIWVSILHRQVAAALNKTHIPKPDRYLSETPAWELPHVEMVFFMIGDSNWVTKDNCFPPFVPHEYKPPLPSYTRENDFPENEARTMPLSGRGTLISWVETEEGREVTWGTTRFNFTNTMLGDILCNFFTDNMKWYDLGASMDKPMPGGLGKFIAERYPELSPRHASAIAAIMVHEKLIQFKGESPIKLRK